MSILNSTPQADNFFMPAEWAKQDAVWMIWPYRKDNWRRNAIPGEVAYAQVAEAISSHTPVKMAVPEDQLSFAKQVMPSNVTLVPYASDDAWCRDTGPTIVVNQLGERRAIDWQFNAYGGSDGLYAPFNNDAALASQIAEYHSFDIYKAPIILEGGSIHVDGEGTCLTTEECLLNPNRNPGYSKEQIEEILKEYLNVQKVIWLKEGVFNDETSGHIDNMACFIRPAEIMLTWTDDVNDPQYARSKAAYDVLTQETDAKGRPFKVWKITQPGPLYSTEAEVQDVILDNAAKNRLSGDRLGGSYINFLITNNAVIFPLLDPKTDCAAEMLFHVVFPEHKIIGVPGREILLGGGCIHCITQQIPS